MSYGKTVRELRQQSGKTVDLITHEINKTPGWLMHVETGKSSAPGPELTIKLSQALLASPAKVRELLRLSLTEKKRLSIDGLPRDLVERLADVVEEYYMGTQKEESVSSK